MVSRQHEPRVLAVAVLQTPCVTSGRVLDVWASLLACELKEPGLSLA